MNRIRRGARAGSDSPINGRWVGHFVCMVCSAACFAGCSDERIVFAVGAGAEAGTREVLDAAESDAEAGIARSTSQPLLCVPGTYVGALNGTYRSEPGGVCGVVAGAEEPSLGQWSFALLSTGGSEFATVKAGCAHFARNAMADGGTNYGHRAEISGSVDCTTGMFSAVVRGTYISIGMCDLGLVWTHYFYKGAMTGRFDLASQSFVDTDYYLAERPPLLGPPAGGNGTWTGSLALDAGVDDTPTEDCLGIDFPEDLAPIPILDGGL